MNSSYQSEIVFREKLGRLLLGRSVVFLAILLALGMMLTRTASSQVVYSGDKGGFRLSAGATGSGYEVEYGQQKLLGVAGFVDLDTTRRFGVEGEARFLMFHNPDQLETRTYMGGPRYHFSKGKFQFYGKGLVGYGQFTFPYDLAHGNYLVIAPGGGVDYMWKHRIAIRVADIEYQIWPQFTYGSMNSYGVSAGIRYHIR
jgi:hypothetical protein